MNTSPFKGLLTALLLGSLVGCASETSTMSPSSISSSSSSATAATVSSESRSTAPPPATVSSSATRLREQNLIHYTGSDYTGVDTIFTLALPSDWVGFGAQTGEPREIKFVGDTTRYGTKEEGDLMYVARVLTNDNTQGRAPGQSWYDFYIGKDNPRLVILEQEQRGDTSFSVLQTRTNVESTFPYLFVFEKDDTIVGLEFKHDNAVTRSIVNSFRFTK